jgi:hypothetical protein
MAASMPALPLFEGGKALLQPTYVCDVADALVTIIEVTGTQILVIFRNVFENVCGHRSNDKTKLP